MEAITYEVSEGIGHLTLNRPEALNSINMEMIAEVRSAVADFAADDNARVLLVTGNGRGFCAGVDLSANVAGDDDMSRGERVAHGMDIGFKPMVRELSEVPKPVVTAVNGMTAGGGVGLTLSGDIVVAARSAKFVKSSDPVWPSSLTWDAPGSPLTLSVVPVRAHLPS